MTSGERPKRPKSHSIGDLGQNAAAAVLLSWGWTAGVVSSDYGEDLESNIFANEQRTNLYFRIQVKAIASVTSHSSRFANGDYKVKISGDLCRQWIGEMFPVFIVVYDQSSRSLKWCNPVEVLHSNPKLLAQTVVTFRVSSQQDFSESKRDIALIVEQFYAKLLRIDRLHLRCEIYPLLMPGYRAEALREKWLDRTKILPSRNPTFFDSARSVDDLPGWMSCIKSVYPNGIPCLEVSAEEMDIESFLSRLRVLLYTSGYPIARPGWISIIVSPVRFEGGDSTQDDLLVHQREVTDWQSLSIIGNRIIEDAEHSFLKSKGFWHGSGVRSLSWDGYYYVKPALDLALQCFAAAHPGPGEAARSELTRKSVRAQMMPWICKESDVERLQLMLASAELSFSETPDVKCEDGEVAGVIAPFMTNPRLGMYSAISTWDELDHGLVALQLRANGLTHLLPGRLGGKESWAVLEKVWAHVMEPPVDNLLYDIRNFRRGLPLNLQKRRMVLMRTRRHVETLPSKRTVGLVRRLFIRSLGSSGKLLSLYLEAFENFGRKSVVLTLAVSPVFSFDITEFYSLIEQNVFDAFEMLLPFKPSEDSETFSMLSMEGQIGLHIAADLL